LGGKLFNADAAVPVPIQKVFIGIGHFGQVKKI
jgi:hypothetical protein